MTALHTQNQMHPASNTTAAPPAQHPTPCRPTLGANLRAVTRRVRAAGGVGTTANPYSVAVPVTAPNEWTVQAATGSNVNGASDADDWTTPVAAGAWLAGGSLGCPPAAPSGSRRREVPRCC